MFKNHNEIWNKINIELYHKKLELTRNHHLIYFVEGTKTEPSFHVLRGVETY